ncbi:MAG: hypothetical protein FJX57_24715, partial [Alphaproteobacteria bacterium]|nr:hypothetical protein [Alphaproteobacteria bacterium]
MTLMTRRRFAALSAAAIGGCQADGATPPAATAVLVGSRFSIIPFAVARERIGRGGGTTSGIVRRARGAVERAPDPIPSIQVEGRMPGQAPYDRSVEATRDFPRILEFAIAWHATVEAPFLAAADRFLRAWMDVYRVNLNPINEERFEVLFLAADLVRGHVDPGTDAGIDRLARRFAEGY